MHQILLIGAGTMGRTHARAYSQMDGVKVAGVVDISKDRAAKVAEMFECPSFSTYEAAKEELEKYDIVDICVPTPDHTEYIRKAADDGKQIICEKPLARNVEQAKEAIEYCKEKGVGLYVGHVVRFFPEYELAKKRIESGVIGEPAVASLSRVGPFPHGTDDWFGDFEASGATVLDLMIHDFDFLRYCFGEVDHVFAKGTLGKDAKHLDYTLATLRFKSGVIAHVEGSWAHEKFVTRFDIAGDKGILEYDSSKETSVVLQERSSEVGKRGVAVPSSPVKHSPYYKELRHFIDCIETGAEPKVTAEDAMEAVRIATSVIESIETGKRVNL